MTEEEKLAEEYIDKEYSELKYEKCERKDFVFTFREIKEMGKQAFIAGYDKAEEEIRQKGRREVAEKIAKMFGIMVSHDETDRFIWALDKVIEARRHK